MRTLEEANREKYKIYETYYKIKCPHCGGLVVCKPSELHETLVLYNPKEEEQEVFTFGVGKLEKHITKAIVSSDPMKDLMTFKCPICGKEHEFERSEIGDIAEHCNYFGETDCKYFELSGKSYQMAKEFRKEHDHSEEFKKEGKMGFSTLGQQFSYTFIPGGLGNGITIKCNHCGETKDITDVDNW